MFIKSGSLQEQINNISVFSAKELNLRKLRQKFITTKFLLTNHIILTAINTFTLIVHMKVDKQGTLLHYISLYENNT